jgi:hypothetical protein
MNHLPAAAERFPDMMTKRSATAVTRVLSSVCNSDSPNLLAIRRRRRTQETRRERNKKRETHTHKRKFSTRVFCARTRGPEEHSVELPSVLCGNRWRILRPRIRRRKRRSQRLSVDDAASCSRRRGDCRFLKQICIFCASSSWRPYSQLTNNKCFWFHSMLYGNCKTRQLEKLAEDGNQIPQLSTDA